MSERETLYLTREEAIKAVKGAYKKGTSHFISITSFLYTSVGGGDEPSKGYESYANLKVSQRQALDFINKILTASFEEKGAKIRVELPAKDDKYGGCIFIG